MNGSLIWLASYPKSGNTWFRAFLTNLIQSSGEPANINTLVSGPIANARGPFEDALGYSASDLSIEELDALRPEIYRHFARTLPDVPAVRYRKIHDAYTYLPDGTPVIPPDVTKAAIYIVRNPLDVCLSLGNHFDSANFDRIIRLMAESDLINPTDPGSGSDHLPSRLLSWSKHVQSWLDAPLKVHLVRYEDMWHSPEDTFRKAASFLDLPDDEDSIQRAIAASQFTELRRQEEAIGFDEKTVQGGFFFNHGKTGHWRQYLTLGQVEQILSDHANTMHRLGYLDESGKPIF